MVDAWQRKMLLNDALCKLPSGSVVCRFVGTKQNPKCQVCKSAIATAATHLPKQFSRKDHWKELNHDGHLIGSCHMAACVERYQMEIDALVGVNSCMALLNRLDEGAHARFTMEQTWPDKKLDCRKSEVWNYLKMLDHVRSEIEAYLNAVEFTTVDTPEAWQEWEKNN